MHIRPGLLALLLMACNGQAQPGQAPQPDWARGPATFSVTGQQAAEVVTVARFVDAYNAGRPEVAMTYLGEEVGGSDCDYRRQVTISFGGRQQTEVWLRDRIGDHDRLDVREVINVNPDQPVGVAGVDWARRTSDTLRALRFRDGVAPLLTAKIVFDRSSHIKAFANGPEGGSAEACRPSVSNRRSAATPPPLPKPLDLAQKPYEVGSRWLGSLKTVAAFEDAYAAGNLERALALLTADTVINDCDFATGRVIDAKGREEVMSLLRAKFADHDSRQLGRIYNESGQSDVVGIVWAKRSSDSLRANGFVSGIRPKQFAKVTFTEAGLIQSFANAGSRGQAMGCQPSADQAVR